MTECKEPPEALPSQLISSPPEPEHLLQDAAVPPGLAAALGAPGSDSNESTKGGHTKTKASSPPNQCSVSKTGNLISSYILGECLPAALQVVNLNTRFMKQSARQGQVLRQAAEPHPQPKACSQGWETCLLCSLPFHHHPLITFHRFHLSQNLLVFFLRGIIAITLHKGFVCLFCTFGFFSLPSVSLLPIHPASKDGNRSTVCFSFYSRSWDAGSGWVHNEACAPQTQMGQHVGHPRFTKQKGRFADNTAQCNNLPAHAC